MSTCKSCNQEIRWIKLESGKMHPCEPKPITYRDCDNGDKLITLDGGVIHVVHGIATAPIEESIGFVSHFANCPQADQWRRKE